MTSPQLSDLARALGRIPTGLYLVATQAPDGPLGFVASLLVQTGFAPPTLCVAIGRDRDHLAAIRSSGRFGVSILDEGSRDVMGVFFRKYAPGQGPFDQLDVGEAPNGSPVLESALAWLECKLAGEFDAGGDHIVVFGEVTDASLQREGDPHVHLRKNGLSY